MKSNIEIEGLERKIDQLTGIVEMLQLDDEMWIKS